MLASVDHRMRQKGTTTQLWWFGILYVIRDGALVCVLVPRSKAGFHSHLVTICLNKHN